MAIAIRSNDMQPMMEMNTTPLIDVMLVLLIMFIVTIPIQSHAVKLDLPHGDSDIVDRTKNKIVITQAGAILWNGSPTSMDRLRRDLAATQRMNPQPELQLQPEALARYALVDQVLAETKRANVTAMGFVGNERYAQF
ncbi:MAG: biopolymer transporter ExbD [Sphingomicrobium sp.]